MVKKRTPIPPHVAARLLFISDHTCCVCRERGRPVQLHHIDENPSNHELSNLSVLCLICHDATLAQGGFSRKLGPAEVVEYRDDWHERVRQRRDRADELAASRQLGSPALATTAEDAEVWGLPQGEVLTTYIQNLPEIVEKAYAKARPGWDSGTTVEMVRASYDLIDVLSGIWLHLSSWFPEGHFGGEPSDEYFSSYIATRFEWHRAINEPQGVGSGGTIVNVVAASSVVSDVELAIEQTVAALFDGEVGFGSWKKAWKEAQKAAIGVEL